MKTLLLLLTAPAVLMAQDMTAPHSSTHLASDPNCTKTGQHYWSTSSLCERFCSVTGTPGTWACGSGGGGTATVATYTSVTFADPPTIACASNTVCSFTITLTGNIASSYTIDTSGITNSGKPVLTLQIVENSGGGNTFAWPTNVLDHGSISTAGNAINVQSFVWDGSNFQAIGPLVVSATSPDQVCINGSTSGVGCIQAPATGGVNSTLPQHAGVVPAVSGSWTTGHCLQAASGDQISDAGAACGSGGGSTTKGTTAYETATYSALPNGTATAMTWDTNGTDDFSGAMHSTSSNTSRFVAQNSGWHAITCTVSMVDGSPVAAWIRKNGTTDMIGTQASPANSGTGGFANVTAYLKLTATDYVECFAYVTIGTRVPNSGTNAYSSQMTMAQLP